ncbi:MAG: hypothetical protein M1814_001233 [Vezdaea aestivalis]|nr:MAG: hypothetical protein M1814_001233 [Vezdaea aestivalis]
MGYPPRASSWMQDNLSWLKDLPIGKILHMPHDSGMDRMSHHTMLAGEDNVLTQIRSMYDQLQLGVRWFDVRPMLHHGTFYCGHATHTGSVGWQALSGTDERNLMRQLFEGLQHVYRAVSEENVLEQKLDKYVGTEGCVIIATRADASEGNKIGDDVFQDIERFVTDFMMPVTSALYMQDDFAAIFSSPFVKVFDLVSHRIHNIGRSEAMQPKWFPGQPQALMRFTGGKERATTGQIFQTDRVCDEAPLNMCLAASRAQWCTAMNGQVGEAIDAYGGKLFLDKQVVERVQEKANTGELFQIDNSLFGGDDPWLSSPKSCCIMSSQHINGDGLLWNARFAREYSWIDFAYNVSTIKHITNGAETIATGQELREIYATLVLSAMGELVFQRELSVPNSTSGPVIRYRSVTGHQEKDRNIHEGHEYNLARDIDWIRYQNGVVDLPE